MPSRAELLFEKLQSRDAIDSLLGQAEDADFDCKQWFSHSDMRFPIAKAACGFSNGTGGVIIVGLRAEGRNGEPDLVKELRPVDDMGAVKASALDIILKFVKPGIEGVQVELVSESLRSIRGYVLIFIPEGEGSPQRCEAKPKDFYVRIASGTVPMEYFQVEDRFGRRPRARLAITSSPPTIEGQILGGSAERVVSIDVENEGRGIAQYPALRIKLDSGFFPATDVTGNSTSIWKMFSSNQGWCSFRGGSSDLIFPGEKLTVAKLKQYGTKRGAQHSAQDPYGHRPLLHDWDFPENNLTVEVVCDGLPLVRRTFHFSSYFHNGRKEP